MPLAATCPHCSRRFQYQEEDQGARADCPHCGKPARLPIVNQPAASRFEIEEDTSSPAETKRRDPEGWWYSFLEICSKAFLVLGVGLIILSTGTVCLILWQSWQPHPSSIIATAICIIILLLGALVGMLAIALTVAFVLLCVDAARNVRKSRQLLQRMNERLPGG